MQSFLLQFLLDSILHNYHLRFALTRQIKIKQSGFPKQSLKHGSNKGDARQGGDTSISNPFAQKHGLQTLLSTDGNSNIDSDSNDFFHKISKFKKKVFISCLNEKQNIEPESKLETTANITPNILCTFVRQVRVQGLIKRQWFDNTFSQSYIPMSDLCRENIDLSK